MESLSQGRQVSEPVTLDLPISTFQPALFQAERGLYIAPIRHHSPACAWAVGQMIRELRPAQVLIETPADLAHHIEHLLHPETIAPVALVAIAGEAKDRQAAYYPYTDHSPELVAMRAAREVGAEIGFIDLPLDEKTDRNASPFVPKVQDETHFDSGDYINALCQALGCRDGFALWDHVFEARLGQGGWRDFFTDCGTYCAGIRAATSPDQIEATGDAKREVYMSARIHDALGKGAVVAVVGGFHAPVLTTPAPDKAKPLAQGKSYLIRYNYEAMDALAGYGAGLPQPGYYDALWHAAEQAQGAPDWMQTSAAIVEGFGNWLKDRDISFGVPAKVEALRVAAGLAQMRGRVPILRHDLMDGLKTALVKGEAGRSEVWAERLSHYLRGTRLGEVPADAGAPPLVDDTRARASKLRFDLSDSAERKRKLDIRRKPSQLAASQFLHATQLLELGFGRRGTGPDYIANARTELLFEEWTYAWSPVVEGRLAAAAAYADNLPDACLAQLWHHHRALAEAGTQRDLGALVDMVLKGILAGLADRLPAFLAAIASDIQAYGSFDTVAAAVRRLHGISNARGPLQVPETLDVIGAEAMAFERLVYLCDDLARTSQEDLPNRLDALRIMNEVLGADHSGRLNRAAYDAALDRLLHNGPPPQILGGVLASCVLSGKRTAGHLAAALKGSFAGVTLDQADRIGVLCGVLGAAPQLLWQHQQVLEVVDQFLSDLDEDGFIALLPNLRLAFTTLNPREVDRLGEKLGAIHGIAGHQLIGQHLQFSAQDLAQGLAIDARLRRELETDGLLAWVTP